MEKEIDLNLPEYESKMVIEAYLVPGETYKVTIFESVSYFEAPTLPTVDDAVVTITHNGIVDTIPYDPFADPLTFRFYNYRSPELVPFDYNSEFVLEVRDKKGRVATSRTIIPQPVPIDTITLEFNSDSMAFPLTKFFDNTSTENFYRYQVEKIDIGAEVIDYQFDDKLSATSEIALGSNYNLVKGDTIGVSLFHITPEYYNFLESVNLAVDANGNPFGQPAVIKSNIEGAIGIFTGLGMDQKYLKVK